MYEVASSFPEFISFDHHQPFNSPRKFCINSKLTFFNVEEVVCYTVEVDG